MKKLSYDERDYAARLEKYIADEAFTKQMYGALARRCGGSMAAALRSISADEDRHLKAMQMEYYLLTGDSVCTEKHEHGGEFAELLRLAYSGEGGAAEEYGREAEMHGEESLRKLFLAQSADESRHRAMIRKMLKDMLGM